MKESEILENINNCVERYHNMNLEDTLNQSDILRTLTSNLFFLENYRVQASVKWHSVYFNSTSKTNAGKEREADLKVEELYMYRRIMTAGYRVCDALRSTISINRKEN